MQMSVIYTISCYVLYIVNLYWVLHINKILYNIIFKSINTDIVNHYLCSYIYLFNIPLSIYIYSYSPPNNKYIFDIFSICALSISSYRYHYNIYSRLQQIENYKIPFMDENIIYFINDIICIHIRGVCIIVTNYYNSKHFLPALVISGIFHIYSIYHCIINIFRYFINTYNSNIISNISKEKEDFNTCHHLITSIPIICDMILVFINSTNEIAIPFLCINILVGLSLIVQPFDKLNHLFACHICIIAQNYYICLSNSTN
jgi:hypothetical protein